MGSEMCIRDRSDTMAMIDFDQHSYIPLSSVDFSLTVSPPVFSLDGFTAQLNDDTNNGTPVTDRPWSQLKRIVDRVHEHTCGHAIFSDIRSLLKRNQLWTSAVEHYLSTVIDKCYNFIKFSAPLPSRRVAISTLNRSFNENVCIDNFYLDDLRLLHCMDSVSRYSTCYITPSANMTDEILAFQASWLSQFWNPDYIQADKAFFNDEFQSFLRDRRIGLRPVPSRRHHKNPLEAKHGEIRSIYLRLKHANPGTDPRSLAHQSVTVSNDLYGSDTVSAFELAKGFTKPIDC